MDGKSGQRGLQLHAWQHSQVLACCCVCVCYTLLWQPLVISFCVLQSTPTTESRSTSGGKGRKIRSL